MPRTLHRLAPLVAVALAACHGGAGRAPSNRAGGSGPGAAITITTAYHDDVDVPAWLLDDGGALPAISDDGTAVAALFHDAVDFVGTPVDTVIVWRIADGRELGRVQLTGPEPGADDAPAPAAPPVATARADDATKLLAAHRWVRASPGATLAGDPEGPWGEAGAIRFGDGRVLTLDEHGALVMAGAHLEPAGFPALGSLAVEARRAPGDAACGDVTGLEVLAGGGAGDDWVLLAPRANLGGDSCAGSLGVDTARLFHVRAGH